ncbi:MAG: DUF2089 family protein [Candidatus Cyclobacteriaceae bacterium M3_2C_046]
MSTLKLPLRCPSCEHDLKVKQLQCPHCETEVSGLYALPALTRLTPVHQKFVLQFILASGSLKIMAQKMKLSYPTVRNLLDEIIATIKKMEHENPDL